MSKKTMKQRIALVAVSALGFGLVSTIPANAADNAAVGAANAATAAGVLNVATTPSITGAAVTSVTIANQRSVGLLANSITQITTTLTSTATVRADGAVVFYYTGATQDAATSFVVSAGAAITASTVTVTTGLTNLNATRTKLVAADITVPLVASFAVTPNAGATSFTVEAFDAAASDIDNVATNGAVQLAAIQAGTVATGALKQRYVVTVATTSVSGIYSSADSLVNIDADGAGAATGVDEAGANIIANSSGVGFININLLDAYKVSLDNVGALVVTGTNGAGIRYAAGGGASAPVNITDVSNDTSGTITVARPSAAANKGFATTVTITWNGAVVGTKSFTFLGEVATVTVTPRRIASTVQAQASTDAFRVTYADSAGNALVGLGTTATTVVSSTTTNVVTGAAIGTQGDATNAAKGTITCAAGSSDLFGGGTANLQMQHLNASSGTVVRSNVFPITCQANAFTYTASFDKASYTPGSIATLSISFKDRDGDIVNGYHVVSTTANLIAITGAPSATAVTIPADGNTATDGSGLLGVKTYQFIVGSTEGDFQAIVSVPVVNALNSGQANQTVGYAVKSATTGVSNADVLKSIVALIASINKQIQALQKLILARR